MKGERRHMGLGGILAALALVGASMTPAHTASVSFSGTVINTQDGIGFAPKTAAVTAVGTLAGIRMTLANAPGGHTRVRLTAHDAQMRPAPDVTLPDTVDLSPGERRPVLIAIPVGIGQKRRVQICITAEQGSGSTTRQCARYIATGI